MRRGPTVPSTTRDVPVPRGLEAYSGYGNRANSIGIGVRANRMNPNSLAYRGSQAVASQSQKARKNVVPIKADEDSEA
jgi:hypothetical protein